MPGREVPSLRKADSRTYLRADGAYVTRVSPAPVNFRDGRGHWQPIDNRLVDAGAANGKQGFALENAANSYRAFLPRTLSAPVRVAADSSWLSFRMFGAGGNGIANSATDRYMGALPSVDAAYTATNSALKETLTLRSREAASSFTYVIHASRDIRARALRSGAVTFVNHRRQTVFALAAPFAFDSASGAAHDPSYRAVSQHLTRTRGGYILRLRVKRSWLHARGRQFPVTIDPSVSHVENTGDTRLRTQGADQDCYIKDGTSATTSSCGQTFIDLGWHTSTQRRMLLQFNVQNSLPKAIHVLDAELGLHVFSTTGTGSSTVELHRLTHSWTTGGTWNSYDGTNAWTTAGGDFDSSVAASNTVNGVGWYQWYPRQLVQGWIDGSIANNGVLVKQATERSLDNDYEFDSSSEPNTSLRPYLDVVYEPQTGQRPYYKFESQQLSDRMDLNVNVASGNLLLHASDAKIHGTGLDAGVDRYYNSQLERDTDLGQGAGWLLGTGSGVRLRLTSDAAVFYAPSGYVVSFQKNAGGTFSAPKGVDATLCQVGVTGCTGESTYALTYNHTQIRNNFDSSGKLVSQRDQNGNMIRFAYDTSGHLSTITDTQNRVLNVTTNAAGYISQVSDPTGRTWQYGYDASNELTSYTDPEGKVTHYVYNAAGEIGEVDDPRGGITRITYDTNADQRVTRVDRVNDNGPDDITDFAYSSPTSPCSSGDFGKTVVTAGAVTTSARTTTYCYDKDGKVATVFDGKTPPNKQSVSYSSNSFVNSYTSANNSTSGFNTTVDRDPNSNSVNSVTQATGSSATDANLRSSFAYNTASSASFSPFYPQSAKNTQGHTESYTYDTNGNVKTKADDSSPANQVSVNYDPSHPGWLSSISDANGKTTTYGHDSVGNVTSISPPTLATGTGTQPGQTTVAYDPLARPCVVTDGKNQKTAYTYDKLDRVTAIAKYGSAATVSGCTASGTASGTVSLTYDANGNLTQRTDPVGTSTYAYNELNRLNSQSYPGGTTNTYSYDPEGNLLTLADGGGTVTYAYDADNLLKSVADPGGSCTTSPTSGCTTFTYDKDGNRLTTTYPNGTVLASKYDPANRLTCTMATAGAPASACDTQASPLRRFKYAYLDPAGAETSLRQSVTDQAGSATSYSYDHLDRLAAATTKNSSGTVTDDYQYTLDPNGNITARTAKANGGSTSTTAYAYNNANELCWSVSGSSANGCASAPTGATTYSYDANGNETGSSDGRAYGYNVFDQAISLTPPGGAAQAATYLGPNQSEMVTRRSEQFRYNVLGIGSRVYTDATTGYYTRTDDGALIDERAPDGKYYYVFDGLGSTSARTNASGAIADNYKYDPYGNIVAATESSYPDAFRYTGGLYSTSLGINKFGQRWYDQGIGRWTQPDPVDQTGDLREADKYIYAGDNPINATDPSGMCIILSCDTYHSVGNTISSGANSVYKEGKYVLSEGKKLKDEADKYNPQTYIDSWKCGRELGGWHGGSSEPDAGHCDPLNYILGPVDEAE